MDFWNVQSPTNDYLFYNQREYLYRMTTGGYTPGDPPSDRVLRLLDYAFLQWNDQWFKRREFPKYPHLLESLSPKTKNFVQGASIMIRKGWAIKVIRRQRRRHNLRHWKKASIQGSLSNDDGDIDENGKTAIGLDQQNNNFARDHAFL